jgi:hypothetical protein
MVMESAETGANAAAGGRGSSRPFQERVLFIATVGAGSFTLLAAFGLTLLPDSTRTQQALILVACMALSLAFVTALGAWRNAVRFALASLSAAVAVVCLAALSIATESVRETGASVAGGDASTFSGSTPISRSPDMSDSREQSPDRSRRDGAPPRSTAVTHLDGLAPVRSDLAAGPWTMNDVRYDRGLAAKIGCAYTDGGSAEYNLYRGYTRFHADIGLSDDAEAGVKIRFVVRLDAKVIFEKEVGLGELVSVDRPVSNGFRLSIETYQPVCPAAFGHAVWGDPRISP